MWLPAVLFAATLMSHLVVGVFAVYAAVVIWLIRGPLRTATRAAAIVVVGGLLTAVWTLPLATTLKYTTDMRYEPVNLTVLASGATTSYFDWLFISEHWFLFPLGDRRDRRRDRVPATRDARRRRASGSRRASRSTAGRACATSSARRRRGTSGSCPSGTSCCTSARRSAPPRSCGSPRGSARGWRTAPRTSRDPDRPTTARDAAGRGSPVVDRAPPSHADETADERAATAATAAAARTDDRGRAPRTARIRGSSRDPVSCARSSIAVLLVILTSIVLVRVNAHEGLPARTGRSTTTRATRAARRRTSRSSRSPSTTRSWRPRINSRRAACCGRAATRSARTARRSRSCSCRTGPTGASPRWRASTTRRRRPRRTTSWPRPCSCRSRRTRCAACRTGSLVGSSDPTATFALGVQYLQTLGVRYFAATTELVKSLAAGEPRSHAGRDGARSRQQAADRVDDLRGRRLRARRAARVPAGRGRRHARGPQLEVRRQAAASGGHRRPTSSARGSAPRSRGSTTPTALDRPLTADGPDSWQHATQENARNATKKALPAGHGVEHPLDRRQHRVRRVPHRCARDGEDVVLPELGGRGRDRAVPGHAELHGGRAHEQARDAGVRHHHRRMGGPAPAPSSASSGWGCWCGGAGTARAGKGDGAPRPNAVADEESGAGGDGSPGNRRRKRSTVRLRSP